MLDDMGGMMMGKGLLWVLRPLVPLLVAAAAVKCLFFDTRHRD